MVVQPIEWKYGSKIGVQLVRQGGGAGFDRRDRLEVRELLALEQVVPERRAYGHFPMVAWGHRGARSG
jgi:hypothetical protein